MLLPWATAHALLLQETEGDQAHNASSSMYPLLLPPPSLLVVNYKNSRQPRALCETCPFLFMMFHREFEFRHGRLRFPFFRFSLSVSVRVETTIECIL